LTVRAEPLGRHGGQVSLPGGFVDAGETFEQPHCGKPTREVGLSTDLVRVLGALTPLDIPVSGFRLHPIVGVSERRPQLTPATHEVARILEPAIDALMAPDCVVRATRARRRRDDVPGFISKASKSGAPPPWCSRNSSRCWAGRRRRTCDPRSVQAAHENRKHPRRSRPH
jgi:hypothetical protein